MYLACIFSKMDQFYNWYKVTEVVKKDTDFIPKRGAKVLEFYPSSSGPVYIRDPNIILADILSHQQAEQLHYNDVTMSAMASQITSLTGVYSTVYSGADQGKHQSSASLAFVWGIHRWPVNSLHKWPVTRTCFHLTTSSWEIYSLKFLWLTLFGCQLTWHPTLRE